MALLSPPMSRADRARWQSARTLEDLGELTALWIEGKLASEPGYGGPGSDIESPEMVPVLAALNRAGYVTNTSQAGELFDGGAQRAAVQGFAGAELAARIRAAAAAHGLAVSACSPADVPRWLCRRRGCVIPVTRVGGRTVTGFGVHFSRLFLADEWTGYGICHPDAVSALRGAWQVTVADPEWGRPGLLWQVLAGAARPDSARVHLVSFGYLHGAPPAGAHAVLDVREHFRDPHAAPELRQLTAADDRVRAAVLGTPGAAALAERITGVAMAYLAGPGRAPVVIAVGCAGGRHRSAVLADQAARILTQRGVPAGVVHRDLHRPVIGRAAGRRLQAAAEPLAIGGRP